MFSKQRNSTRSQVKWILITLSPQMQSNPTAQLFVGLCLTSRCGEKWKNQRKKPQIGCCLSTKKQREEYQIVDLILFVYWLSSASVFSGFHLCTRRFIYGACSKKKKKQSCRGWWLLSNLCDNVSMRVSIRPPQLSSPVTKIKTKFQWNWDFFIRSLASFKKTYNVDVVEFPTQFDVDQRRRETAPK